MRNSWFFFMRSIRGICCEMAGILCELLAVILHLPFHLIMAALHRFLLLMFLMWACCLLPLLIKFFTRSRCRDIRERKHHVRKISKIQIVPSVSAVISHSRQLYTSYSAEVFTLKHIPYRYDVS